MKSRYDYVIVGAGLFGAVFAREMLNAGRSCLVVDRRGHIAGNCYTEVRDGIPVHMYGSHVFHTNSKMIWDYVNQYARFNGFINRVKANCDGRIYSLPINLLTLSQVYGVRTPDEARRKLCEVTEDIPAPKNAEEYLLKTIGKELLELFYRGYTEKHWMRPLSSMPISTYLRLPIRTTFDDNYYDHEFQGIPVGGYTPLFERLLDGAEICLSVDYFAERSTLDQLAGTVVFTGRIDEFYGFRYGPLEYRTIDISFKTLDLPDYQGCAVVSHPMHNVAYTKSVEHKHFEGIRTPRTIVSFETPVRWEEGMTPYYPLNDDASNERYSMYKTLSLKDPKYVFGGRLAEYRYYDMHQVVGSALKLSRQILRGATEELIRCESA